MIGQTIAHYQVHDALGAGGMGIVYRATDVTLGRDVALKFLAGHLSDSGQFRDRFLREARSISALNHAHIATIYEAGSTAEGDPFLALEYLPGGTLRERLAKLRAQNQQFPLGEAIQYAIAMCEGLAHAHRNAILHRDIKPANLMFSAEGTLKITDFGLSKYLDQRDSSLGGKRIGTLPYMSPEQLRGAQLDARADIFSAGAVLYEMVTGERAFAGDSEAEVVKRILTGQPRSIAGLRPEAPESIQEIVNRALAKRPEDRYPDAAAMAGALKSLLHNLENSTVTIGITAPKASSLSAAPATRREVWISLSAVAIVALAGWAGSRWWQGSQLPQQKQIAVLPFYAGDGAENTRAFCDGLAETLTSALSQLEQPDGALMVVPAAEVRKQAAESPSDARRAFNANLAITGSVQHEAGQVRVIANLVDTRAMRQIGSRQVVRKAADLAGLQDEIVGNVTALLDLQLGPAARTRLNAGATASGSAYDLYLRGLGLAERFDKSGNLDQAIVLFNSALQKDPRYALAWSGLSEANWRKYTSSRDSRYLEQGLDAGLQATRLDGRVASAHTNLGRVYASMGVADEALEEYKRALALDPVSVEAHRALADAYERQGRLDLAIQTYEKALRLRPHDWLTYSYLGSFFYRTGNYAKAEPLLRKVTELTPDNHIAFRNLGAIHAVMKQFSEAERDYRKAIELNPNSAMSYDGLAGILYYRGRFAEAVPMFEKAVSLSKVESPYLLGNLGDAYRQTPGSQEKALAMYRRAIDSAENALARNPRDFEVLAAKAEFEAKSGLRAAALADATRAQAGAARNIRVLSHAVIAREVAGDHAGSAAMLKSWKTLSGGGDIPPDLLNDPDLGKLKKETPTK